MSVVVMISKRTSTCRLTFCSDLPFCCEGHVARKVGMSQRWQVFPSIKAPEVQEPPRKLIALSPQHSSVYAYWDCLDPAEQPSCSAPRAIVKDQDSFITLKMNQHVVVPPCLPSNDTVTNYPGPATPGQQLLQLKLLLDHNCMHQGCRDEACRHCCHSSTRCSSMLRTKYVSNQPLLACCGGKPEARLVSEMGGDAGPLLLPGWQLQVQLLDNKAYEDLNQHGMPPSTERLASCLVRGSPRLRSGAGQCGSSVMLPLEAGAACLAGLRLIKPEKATEHNKHSGKTTHCRLLLTVIAPPDSAPELPPHLPFVSGPFKVVTTRSKGAVKAEVPLPHEPVSKLRGIGKDAAASLAVLRMTDDDRRQLGPVETVGQFHALQQWVDKGGAPRLQQLLQDTNIKPAAYKEAAEHVQLTAFPDFRPRVWWQQGHVQGLLCRWDQDVTAPGQSLAWVLQQQQQQQQGLPYLLVPLGMAIYAEELQPALQQAQQVWRAEGHGSWEVFWSDEADPLAQQWAQQGMLFDLQALPLGILNAMAAAGAGTTAAQAVAGQTATSAAAATAAAAAPAPADVPAPAVTSMQALLPAQQQQQQQQQQQVQLTQVQPPFLTLDMHQEPQQELPLQQQQQQQQLQQLQQEIEALEERRQAALKRKQQLMLQLDPVIPALSDLPAPLLPASETTKHPLVQAQLQDKADDVPVLMDKQPMLPSPKRQKQQHQQQQQQQQQQQPDQGAADDGHVDSRVLDARPGVFAGSAVEETAGELQGLATEMSDETALAVGLEQQQSWKVARFRAQSMKRLESLQLHRLLFGGTQSS